MKTDPHPLATQMIAAQRQECGWGQEHQRWADRLSAVFGRRAYWLAGAAGRQTRYRRLARQIVREVGAPMGPAAEVNWWATLLARRFGGLDFWNLSPAWKQLTYDNVTREIMLVKRIIREGPGGPRS